ncbi:MAG: CYTH domain-containing protein [Actinomycetota bacterium]
MTTDPSRTVEVERTYDVDPDTELPDWLSVPGIVEVSAPETRLLDAGYVDTHDGALARSGVALRRRTGGPDEGWHVKGPRDGDSRLELGWPLGDDSGIPTAVLSAVAPWTTDPLSPLARIENTRVAYQLRTEHGVVAEFVDDRVRATDLRANVVREWREWEVELGPAAPADDAGRAEFFAAVERAVGAVGGREASSASKLARALGF